MCVCVHVAACARIPSDTDIAILRASHGRFRPQRTPTIDIPPGTVPDGACTHVFFSKGLHGITKKGGAEYSHSVLGVLTLGALGMLAESH